MQGAVDPRPLGIQILRELLGPQRPALRDRLPLGGDPASVDLEPVAIRDQLEELRAGIDQPDSPRTNASGPMFG